MQPPHPFLLECHAKIIVPCARRYVPLSASTVCQHHGNSHVRCYVFTPVSQPRYSHFSAYRGLVKYELLLRGVPVLIMDWLGTRCTVGVVQYFFLFLVVMLRLC